MGVNHIARSAGSTAKMVTMNPTVSNQAKIGGLFGYALTGGIASLSSGHSAGTYLLILIMIGAVAAGLLAFPSQDRKPLWVQLVGEVPPLNIASTEPARTPASVALSKPAANEQAESKTGEKQSKPMQPLPNPSLVRPD